MNEQAHTRTHAHTDTSYDFNPINTYTTPPIPRTHPPTYLEANVVVDEGILAGLACALQGHVRVQVELVELGAHDGVRGVSAAVHD